MAKTDFAGAHTIAALPRNAHSVPTPAAKYDIPALLAAKNLTLLQSAIAAE